MTGLYAILDLSVSARGSAAPDEALDRALAEAMAGGCRLFQYRDKTAIGREMLTRATRLATACRAADATFIINDRLDVALLCGADGCHLGQDDLPPSSARRLAPAGFLIGVSTHDASEARRAADDGADYVGVGAVYPTATKADARPARGPALVAEIAAAVAIPSVAIGGITHRNVRPVIRAGAAAVAVASALFAAPDIAASAREFIRIWDEEKRNL